MKLKTIEFEKKDVLINRVRLEELSENLLEEMNKQLIIYMATKILWILSINELKKMLKEMELFFVLQLMEIVLFIGNTIKKLNSNRLYRHSPEFLCSVLGSGGSLYLLQIRAISILIIGHPILLKIRK
jgi:hypothetical protein